jgi:hypothetical protein
MLMQMNLCLSGLADCYGKAAYPAVAEEAVARICARTQPKPQQPDPTQPAVWANDRYWRFAY